MLRLDPDRSARWLEMPKGVRLAVRPASRQVMAEARKAAWAGTDPDDPDDLVAVGEALAVALARGAIVEWEGVGDPKGQPVPATPEWIDLLMEDPALFEAWQGRYVFPALGIELEKNASAPSPRVSWAHPVEGPIDSDRASTSDESGLAGDLFDVERVHPATPETTRCVRVQFQPPD